MEQLDSLLNRNKITFNVSDKLRHSLLHIKSYDTSITISGLNSKRVCIPNVNDNKPITLN